MTSKKKIKIPDEDLAILKGLGIFVDGTTELFSIDFYQYGENHHATSQETFFFSFDKDRPVVFLEYTNWNDSSERLSVRFVDHFEIGHLKESIDKLLDKIEHFPYKNVCLLSSKYHEKMKD